MSHYRKMSVRVSHLLEKFETVVSISIGNKPLWPISKSLSTNSDVLDMFQFRD